MIDAGVILREDFPPGLAELMPFHRYVAIKRKDDVKGNILLKSIPDTYTGQVANIFVNVSRHDINISTRRLPDNIRNRTIMIVHTIDCTLDDGKIRCFRLPNNMPGDFIFNAIVALLDDVRIDDLVASLSDDLVSNDGSIYTTNTDEILVDHLARETRLGVRATDLKRLGNP